MEKDTGAGIGCSDNLSNAGLCVRSFYKGSDTRLPLPSGSVLILSVGNGSLWKEDNSGGCAEYPYVVSHGSVAAGCNWG